MCHPTPPAASRAVRFSPGVRVSETGSGTATKDAALQNWMDPLAMPTPIVNFDALRNADNGNVRITPPNTKGDVGPNHYVEWINGVFAVYDKQGNKLYGPAVGNTLWSGFGGDCETRNDGDPIALN